MTNMRSPAISLCVLVLVIIAGCSAPQPIDVTIVDISEEQQDGVTTFEGTFTPVDGYQARFIIEDVRILFEADNGRVLHTESVGQVNGTDFSYDLSVRLEEPPQTIRILTGTTKTKANVDVQNLRRNDTGGWEWYYPEREN